MRLHLLVATLFLPLAGCGDELVGPKVVISNRSGHVLNNLTLSGSGFVTSIGQLSPESVESATLHPTGESALRVTFDVDGRHVDSGEHGYSENSVLYKLAVDVDRDLKVSVTVALRG